MAYTAQEAVSNAWKIHDAQVAWTGQVDSKASVVLAIESAVMAGIVMFFGGGRRLHHLEDGWTVGLAIAGILLIVLAILSVAYVVRPRLRTTEIATEASDNFIFFGHVRYWSEADLTTALTEVDLLSVLSRQIIWMAKVAWRKHRFLQISVTLAVVGTGLITAAAALNG